MAIKFASNLSRNRYGVLHFRLAIPPDLRSHFKVKEIYRSLHTASIKDAVDQAQTLSMALKRAFAAIRQQSMSNDKKSPTGPISLEHVIKHAQEKLYLRSRIDEAEQATAAAVDAHRLDKHRNDETLAIVVRESMKEVAPPIPPASFLISSYLDGWLDSCSPANDPLKPKTIESYRAAVQTLIKIVGDKTLREFSYGDQNRFDDVVTKLPPNSTKLAATRDLSTDAILLLGLPPNSIVNAKNIARRATNFLKWACKREGFKCLFELCDDVKITKKKKGAKNRRAFTDDELRVVFNPETFGTSAQAGPYIFWLPLIGVHTGMRINEIGQLMVSDLVIKDGVHCFDVNDEPDQDEEAELNKSVKTEAAKRLVPVHSRLIELGLLDYAVALRNAGHRRLFPDLSDEARDGPGQPASKHFARYCNRIGLSNPMLVFHSFRHGAVGRMRAAGVPKELRMVVVGHSALEDTHDGYGDINNDHSIISKHDAIEALNFDSALDYVALRTAAPTVHDLKRALARIAKRAGRPVT